MLLLGNFIFFSDLRSRVRFPGKEPFSGWRAWKWWSAAKITAAAGATTPSPFTPTFRPSTPYPSLLRVQVHLAAVAPNSNHHLKVNLLFTCHDKPRWNVTRLFLPAATNSDMALQLLHGAPLYVEKGNEGRGAFFSRFLSSFRDRSCPPSPGRSFRSKIMLLSHSLMTSMTCLPMIDWFLSLVMYAWMNASL